MSGKDAKRERSRGVRCRCTREMRVDEDGNRYCPSGCPPARRYVLDKNRGPKERR